MSSSQQHSSRGGSVPSHQSVAWYIAWRYFFAKKSSNAVHILAIVAVAGIAMVTFAMVVVLSVFNGFEELTDRRFTDLAPEYMVVERDGATFDARDVAMEGWSPVLKVQAVAAYEGSQSVVQLVGIEQDSYLGVVPLSEYLFDGDFEVGTDSVPLAVMGLGVASALGVGVDYATPVEITIPRRGAAVSSLLPQRNFSVHDFRVSGVVATDQPEDGVTVYVSLPVLRRMLGYHGEEVTALVGDGSTTGAPSYAQLQRQLDDTAPQGLRLLDRRAQFPEVYKVLRIEKLVSFLLLSFVLLLTLFGVVSTLGMLIIEKREDTELLSKLGAPQKLLDRITLHETWFLSIFGLVIGLPLGVLIVLLQQHLGIVRLDDGGLGAFIVDSYPVLLRPMDLLYVAGLVLGVGWVAGRIAYRLFTIRRR